MTVATLDPQLENLKKQIEGAFTGGPGPDGKDFAAGTPPITFVHDASSMASAMLSAYHVATVVNPNKAFKAKAFTPQVQLSDPSELTQKNWFHSFLSIVQTVGPVIINALSKDFQPQAPNLATIIQALPPERRNDKDFVDYATTLLLTLGQATVEALSGKKDFTTPNTQVYIPQPPPGMPKGWFDDVCKFVADAAPVVIPIVMSLI